MSFTRLFSCLYVFLYICLSLNRRKICIFAGYEGAGSSSKRRKRQVQVKEGKETGYGKEKTAGSTGL